MLYFHLLEISRKFTIVACEQLHVVCIVDLWLLLYSVLWFFFWFFFHFHYPVLWTGIEPEWKCYSDSIHLFSPCVSRNFRGGEFLRPLCRIRDKGSGKHSLPENGIIMETGLPTKEVFKIVVRHDSNFKDSINYFRGWKVESVIFEDQIFIALMKVRKNETDLHLVQLFNCSVATIRHIITTFIHVLHSIFFHDIMTSFPTQETT